METKDKKFGRVVTALKCGIFLTAISLVTVACDENKKVESIEEEEEVLTSEDKEPKERGPSNPNLKSSVEAFLTQWTESKNEDLKTMITENFDSVTGNFAYPVHVNETGEIVKLDLGLSQVEVPQQKIVAHKGFLDSVVDLEQDSNGLAIVRYDANNITNIEIYQLTDSFEDIRDAILKAIIPTKDKSKSIEEAQEEKDYSGLTSDEWKGMALLTAREIASKDMAPIFLVPNSAISSQKDLADTFYYIISGTLDSIDDSGITLKTYEDKRIQLDFGLKMEQDMKGLPVWIHVITQDGLIQNVEIQAFPGANAKTMAEGIITYISLASILLQEESN